VWLPYAWYAARFDTAAVGLNLPTAGGALLIVLGVAGYLASALGFALEGRGTPAPIDPPKTLVVRGLYHYVRNPMYVSVAAVLLGQSLLYRSGELLRYTLVAWAIIHLVLIFYEEPVLRGRFGASYEDYCRRVPRWIPRLPRAGAPPDTSAAP
jgi:protein-S-isoprenylcysteine O-methyltransferase Ste14